MELFFSAEPPPSIMSIIERGTDGRAPVNERLWVRTNLALPRVVNAALTEFFDRQTCGRPGLYRRLRNSNSGLRTTVPQTWQAPTHTKWIRDALIRAEVEHHYYFGARSRQVFWRQCYDDIRINLAISWALIPDVTTEAFVTAPTNGPQCSGDHAEWQKRPDEATYSNYGLVWQAK